MKYVAQHCGSLVMLNAATYIATNPRDLLYAVKDGLAIADASNDDRIRHHVSEAERRGGIVFVCWGSKLGEIDPRRQLALWSLLEPFAPQCLGVNKDRSPVHPLYIPYARPLALWSPLHG